MAAIMSGSTLACGRRDLHMYSSTNVGHMWDAHPLTFCLTCILPGLDGTSCGRVNMAKWMILCLVHVRMGIEPIIYAAYSSLQMRLPWVVFRWIMGMRVHALPHPLRGTNSMKNSLVVRSTPPKTHCSDTGRPWMFPRFLLQRSPTRRWQPRVPADRPPLLRIGGQVSRANITHTSLLRCNGWPQSEHTKATKYSQFIYLFIYLL